MNKPKIIAYLKPTCGWSQGVRAIMRKYDLPFEDRDIINDPLQRQEMIEKSGQMLSPCHEVEGNIPPRERSRKPPSARHQRRGSRSLFTVQRPRAAGESRSRFANEPTLRP